MAAIQLIVGLGNPGPNYAPTRHNAGVWFVEKWCAQQNLTFKTEPKFKGRLTRFSCYSHDCHVLIPTTYMNLSGDSVRIVSQFYKIPSRHILVVHDDIDLPPGTVKLKLDGGHGGHNGLRDITLKLQTDEFYRLRIGVGHPGNKEEVIHYVTQKPSNTDRLQILAAIDEALLVLPDVLEGNSEKAMQFLHTKK